MIIDLTLPVSGKFLNVELEPDDRLKSHGVTMSWLRLHSHAGTHMDAPRHFLPEGKTMESVALEKCVGLAHVLDVTHVAQDDFITVDDLKPYESYIVPRSRILLRTDWGEEFGQPHYSSHFPRIHVSAANWLASKGIWLIGIEPPSVAKLGNLQELIDVHHAFLKHEIVIVEGLINLKSLPFTVTFMAMPLKIIGGDGTPTRAVAVVEDDVNEQAT